MSLSPGAETPGKNEPPVTSPVAVAEAAAAHQKQLDFSLSGHRARLLMRLEGIVADELSERPAGVSAAIVAGTLRAMYRESDDGARPSCTTRYQDVAKFTGSSRRQVAAAIKWLKSREWLDVLSAGPSRGVYAVQWPRIEADLAGGAPPVGRKSARERVGRPGAAPSPT
jgi:hypothetical protein